MESKSKSINHFKFFMLSKPDGTVFLFLKYMDSQGHTPTLGHHLQTKQVFSESARSEAIGMTRDVLLISA